jgi:hypothetical protein
VTGDDRLLRHALAPGGGAVLTHWLGTPRMAFFLLAGLAAVGSVIGWRSVI